MKNATQGIRKRYFERVVAILDVSAHQRRVLSSAAEVARRLDVELTTVWVRDARLARLGDHPAARMMGLPGGLGRLPLAADLDRSWRARGRQLEREHRRLVESLGLRGQFAIDERSREAAAQAYAEGGHLVVVGQAVRALGGRLTGFGEGAEVFGRLPGAQMWVGQQGPRLRSVLLIDDGSVASRQAREAARQLAGAATVTVLVVEGGADKAQSQSPWEEAAGTQAPWRVYCRRLATADAAAISLVADRLGADLIIIPGTQYGAMAGHSAELSDRGRRPLCFVAGFAAAENNPG